MFLLNAFSINMLTGFPVNVSFTEVSSDYVASLEGLVSAIGHADTAAVFGDVLGVPVLSNRATVSLVSGDKAIVGQYRGARLPEGTTKLPEGSTIQWLEISVG